MLDTLRAFMEICDTRAHEVWEAEAALLRTALGAHATPVYRALLAFDFDGALALLERVTAADELLGS